MVERSDLASSEHWKAEWKRKPAWTAAQLAKLCCGWNPGSEAIPDPHLYSRTLETIKGAVWVKDADLPVRDVRWPPDEAAVFYGAAPVFTPSEVWRWAKTHYPETFPFSAADFPSECESEPGLRVAPANKQNIPSLSERHDAQVEGSATQSRGASDVTEPADPTPDANVFRLTPEGWSIRYEDDDVSGFERLKGMSMIRTLLTYPSLPDAEPVRISSAKLDDPDSEPFIDDGDPIIDLNKIEEQKQELLEECRRAAACQDEAREAKAEEKLEALSTYVRKNVGRRGRPRRLGSRAEKARKRVLKNYTTALRRLEEVAPSFAKHLDDSVQLGHWSTYTPKTDLNWKT